MKTIKAFVNIYYKLVDVISGRGGLEVDSLLPKLHDSISAVRILAHTLNHTIWGNYIFNIFP